MTRLEEKLKEIREQRFALLAKRDELARLAVSYQNEIQTIDRSILQMDGAIEGLLFALQPVPGDGSLDVTPELAPVGH